MDREQGFIREMPPDPFHFLLQKSITDVCEDGIGVVRSRLSTETPYTISSNWLGLPGTSPLEPDSLPITLVQPYTPENTVRRCVRDLLGSDRRSSSEINDPREIHDELGNEKPTTEQMYFESERVATRTAVSINGPSAVSDSRGALSPRRQSGRSWS